MKRRSCPRAFLADEEVVAGALLGRERALLGASSKAGPGAMGELADRVCRVSLVPYRFYLRILKLRDVI